MLERTTYLKEMNYKINTMKNLLLFIFITTTLNLSADNWTQKSNAPTSLSLSACFSIGNKGYVCGGYKSAQNYVYTKEFWEYDKLTDTWTQKADFPDDSIVRPTAFSIQGKGYVGLGYNCAGSYVNSFWKYDPTIDIWTQIADFPGNARFGATAFTINDKGYVFGGTPSNFGGVNNDLWEYDPTLDIWTQKTSCPGFSSFEGISFSIANKGYVGGGFDSLGCTNEFWEYNHINDSWIQKATIPIVEIGDIGCFSIGNFGYFTCGEAYGGGYITTLWQYNALLDQWVSKTNFPGVSRDEPATFSIGNSGYVGLGGKDGNPMYIDFWEYTPDSSDMVFVTEIMKLQTITVYPNPFKTNTSIAFVEPQTNVLITIIDVLGKEIKSIPFTGKQFTFNKGEMKEGVYFVQVTDKKNNVVNKKIIIQ
jgi:N-acetylneuraminic acid mutarotase